MSLPLHIVIAFAAKGEGRVTDSAREENDQVLNHRLPVTTAFIDNVQAHAQAVKRRGNIFVYRYTQQKQQGGQWRLYPSRGGKKPPQDIGHTGRTQRNDLRTLSSDCSPCSGSCKVQTQVQALCERGTEMFSQDVRSSAESFASTAVGRRTEGFRCVPNGFESCGLESARLHELTY
jgi:hypothetical protein